MIEGINNTVKVQNSETASAAAAPAKSPGPYSQPDQKAQEKIKPEKGAQAQVSQSLLDDLQQDIKMIHDVGLKFSMHEATGQTMVKVINKDSGKLIREIPPEQILNLAAKIDEMIGILFDAKA